MLTLHRIKTRTGASGASNVSAYSGALLCVLVLAVVSDGRGIHFSVTYWQLYRMGVALLSAGALGVVVARLLYELRRAQRAAYVAVEVATAVTTRM